jgi:hypothetical protein
MKSAKVENGANGISNMEGKAVRVAASECGQRVSFNWSLSVEGLRPPLHREATVNDHGYSSSFLIREPGENGYAA